VINTLAGNIAITGSGIVNAAGFGALNAIQAQITNSASAGTATVNFNGSVIGDAFGGAGILATTNGSGNATVTGTGSVTGAGGVEATNTGTGNASVVWNGTVSGLVASAAAGSATIARDRDDGGRGLRRRHGEHTGGEGSAP